MLCDEDIHVIGPRCATYKEVQVDELFVRNEDEAFTLVSDLKKLHRSYVPNKKDGDCMYRAILSCINVPSGVTISGFRKQIACYIMRNIHFFRKKLSLAECENLESFIRNLAGGLTFGDRNTLQAVAVMWNVTISVLNPFSQEDRVWHNETLDKVDIVLCWNGLNHYTGSVFSEEPSVRLSPKKPYLITKCEAQNPVRVKCEKKDDISSSSDSSKSSEDESHEANDQNEEHGNEAHTKVGENKNETQVGENQNETQVGENQNETQVGENQNETYDDNGKVGENQNETQVGENQNETCDDNGKVGENQNQTHSNDKVDENQHETVTTSQTSSPEIIEISETGDNPGPITLKNPAVVGKNSEQPVQVASLMYSDISGDEEGSNDIMDLVEQSIVNAENSSTKKRRKSLPRINQDTTTEKRMRSDDDEAVSTVFPSSSSANTTVASSSKVLFVPGYDTALTEQVRNYRHLNHNINQMREFLEKAEEHRTNAKFYFSKIGIPEQILTAEGDVQYAIINPNVNKQSAVSDDGCGDEIVRDNSNTPAPTPSTPIPSTPIPSAPSTPSTPIPSGPIPSAPSTPIPSEPSTPVPSTPVRSAPSTPIVVSPVNDSIEEIEVTDKIKKEIIVVSSDDDFTVKIKKEPGTERKKKKKKRYHEQSGSPKQGSSKADDSLSKKNIIEITTQGRFLCSKNCGKTFSTKYNMLKHVKDEVCQKPVSQRSEKRYCIVEGCDHYTIGKSAAVAHHMGHMKIKMYECSVQGCDHSFVHQSSLVNHKHDMHTEIFGPAPHKEVKERKNKDSDDIVVVVDVDAKKKKKKKKRDPFSDSDSD